MTKRLLLNIQFREATPNLSGVPLSTLDNFFRRRPSPVSQLYSASTPGSQSVIKLSSSLVALMLDGSISHTSRGRLIIVAA